MEDIDKLLNIVKNGNENEACKAMYELNSSALHEMTKDPHQVIQYSRILRQIRYLAGNHAYSFIFEAGKLCGYVEAFETIAKNEEKTL